jgi:hypothetical protein
MKPKTKERVLFYQFLKENRITKEFVFNHRNHRASPPISIIELISEDYKSIILSSFIWSRSKEGSRFWGDLDHEWREYLDQHNK